MWGTTSTSSAMPRSLQWKSCEWKRIGNDSYGREDMEIQLRVEETPMCI
jgi:hypothetical protein